MSFITNTIVATTNTIESNPSLLTPLGLLFAGGFVTATLFGSLAWYNSKRPVGWKGEERPDFMPNLER
ncbi:MAG: photosystem II assembly protein Psb35 [Spirulinaceae cyanobacterium]